MPHVMLPASPFRRASLPDPPPPQPPVPDPAPEPGPAPIPDPTPNRGVEGPDLAERSARPTLAATPDDGEGGDDDEAEQSDPGGDSDPHPPLPEPGAA